jgi:hemerythrin superfamily protein
MATESTSTTGPGERYKSRAGAASTGIGAAASRASRMASPEITTMIRLDHTHVLAALRRYHPGSSPQRKQAVVANACLGLEIHATLEEEIFYPAVFAQADGTHEDREKHFSEHEQMRSVMGRLRQMTPRDAQYEETFYELMRTVLHHVADEETILLPLAEAKLKDRLRELGWQMTLRRFELLKPHVAEVASTTVRTFPILTGAFAAGVLALAWLILRPGRST